LPLSGIEWEEGRIKIIDQTKLPQEVVYLHLESVDQVREAICKMRIRGAPALGVAAALGVVLGIRSFKAKDYATLKAELEKLCQYLESSRPTAVNLFWATDRLRHFVEKNPEFSPSQLKEGLKKEALRILEEDKHCTRALGEKGAHLINDGDAILTHCNAGALATAGEGTALSVIYRAKKQGKRIKVYVDETRPLLQGARLTAWELLQEGIEVVLICDGMAGKVMREGKIDKVIVGADRVAANGDVANKIGTYSLAVLAKENKIPFYVVCPLSTIDLSLSSGEEIPIEIREEREVTTILGREVAPPGVKVYNPAFDVTPSGYISAIITERGVGYPPYRKSFSEVLGLHR
jgi:methylthioribose-1-phosphate isomerase